MFSTKKSTAALLAVPALVGGLALTAPADASQTKTSVSADATTAGSGRQDPRITAPSRSRAPFRFGTVQYNQWYAFNYMQYKYGWGASQRASLRKLWNHESGWSHHAHNSSSGAHGIPQALPGSKMAVSGPNWRSNPETQIKWGLSYIKSRYGTPNGAWSAWLSKGWY